jgi:hypothetical protein
MNRDTKPIAGLYQLSRMREITQEAKTRNVSTEELSLNAKITMKDDSVPKFFTKKFRRCIFLIAKLW